MRIELRKQIYALVLLLGMLFASPAVAMVYRWTDSSGNIHYTNKDYEVPARYKSKTTALYPDATDATPPQPEQPRSVLKPPDATQPSANQAMKNDVPTITKPVEAPIKPVKAGKRLRKSSANDE